MSKIYKRFWASAGLLALLAAAGASHAGEGVDELEAQLRATEIAFAATMANRDHGAFTAFLAEEAIFFAAQGPIRGRTAIADAWRSYYEGEEAPFSWAPDDVAVLAPGDLGMTSGPVLDASGNPVGRFNSVWRRGPDGQWKIVLDRGCDCP